LEEVDVDMFGISGKAGLQTAPVGKKSSFYQPFWNLPRLCLTLLEGEDAPEDGEVGGGFMEAEMVSAVRLIVSVTVLALDPFSE
jgi:hypothetical protein